jgi:RND family efflux transporter MFP subunit
MNTKKILLICGGILLAGILITTLIFSTEPTAQREGATRETAMLVDVTQVERGDFEPVISATGNVRAVEDITLSPLVGGEVVRRSPAFTPGGFVKKGEVLLQIDPADYRNTLELRRSDYLQAQTDLNVEMGRQQVAKQDLALIGGDSLSPEEKILVLRQPQLDAVRARLKAAKATVDQAELSLARTTIRAPFDAHILTQNVTTGSQVSPGDDLGRLVGTDFYWVELNVPVTKLQWLTFPDAEHDKGATVRIMNRSAWKNSDYREGELFRQVGALDNQTRLARVLVRVEDPLAHEEGNTQKPKLMIGSFVDAEIEARTIEDVVRLDRDHLRTNQTVWVMKDGKLQIRNVDVVLSDAGHTYISKGLEHEEMVVTTNLSTVAEGIGLRTESDSGDGEEKPIEVSATEE